MNELEDALGKMTVEPFAVRAVDNEDGMSGLPISDTFDKNVTTLDMVYDLRELGPALNNDFGSKQRNNIRFRYDMTDMNKEWSIEDLAAGAGLM